MRRSEGEGVRIARPRVVSLHIHPVKGARGLSVEQFEVTPRGVVGDRTWMVVDADGRFVSQRNAPWIARIVPRLLSGGGLELTWDTLDGPSAERSVLVVPPTVVPPPDGHERPLDVFGRPVSGVDAGDEAAEWLSDVMGRRMRLVSSSSQPGHYVDAAPLLVTTTASLEALDRGTAGGIPGAHAMERFRPNIVVDSDVPWEEDMWTHLETRGGVRFRVEGPCLRCSVPGVNPRSGDQTKEPLAALARQRRVEGGVAFGVYVELDVPLDRAPFGPEPGPISPADVRMTVMKG